MKPSIEISIEHYESLLKYASDTSPLYLRLKNAVKTDANTIAMLCDLDGAEKLGPGPAVLKTNAHVGKSGFYGK